LGERKGKGHVSKEEGKERGKEERGEEERGEEESEEESEERGSEERAKKGATHISIASSSDSC
jgi:hypothetical protein